MESASQSLVRVLLQLDTLLALLRLSRERCRSCCFLSRGKTVLCILQAIVFAVISPGVADLRRFGERPCLQVGKPRHNGSDPRRGSRAKGRRQASNLSSDVQIGKQRAQHSCGWAPLLVNQHSGTEGEHLSPGPAPCENVARCAEVFVCARKLRHLLATFCTAGSLLPRSVMQRPPTLKMRAFQLTFKVGKSCSACSESQRLQSAQSMRS